MSRFLSIHKTKSSQDDLENLNMLSMICHCKKKMESKTKKRIYNFKSSFFPKIQMDQMQYSKIKSPPSLDVKISPPKAFKKKIKKTMNDIYKIEITKEALDDLINILNGNHETKFSNVRIEGDKILVTGRWNMLGEPITNKEAIVIPLEKI